MPGDGHSKGRGTALKGTCRGATTGHLFRVVGQVRGALVVEDGLGKRWQAKGQGRGQSWLRVESLSHGVLLAPDLRHNGIQCMKKTGLGEEAGLSMKEVVASTPSRPPFIRSCVIPSLPFLYKIVSNPRGSKGEGSSLVAGGHP